MRPSYTIVTPYSSVQDERLGMVIEMRNEILIGINKLSHYVSFQIFK